MALLTCRFFSEVLGLSTSMTVILPQATTTQVGMSATASASGRHPTLYLLHGLSDDDSVWVRRTSIERYVAPRGLAVVMPQVHRSFYADQASGLRYRTFLVEELPEIATGFFPLSGAREDCFVAGLSMGGYGALSWALSRPDRFAAAASLSGALDLEAWQEELVQGDDAADRETFELCFGGAPIGGTEHDLFWLLGEHDPASEELPSLYVACGTGDTLVDGNRRFAAAGTRLGWDVTTDFGAGDHDWGYWDAGIQDVLDWLPLRRTDQEPRSLPR